MKGETVTGSLEELVLVAAEEGADYFALRAAVIRGAVHGQRQGRRWFCSRASARAYLEARGAARRFAEQPSVT